MIPSIMFQIRMIIDKFGIAAVRSAWYDSNQVSDDVLQGYTKVSSCYSFYTRWPDGWLLSLFTLKMAAIEGQGLGQGTSRIHGCDSSRFDVEIK